MPEPTHSPNLPQLIRHFEQLTAASGAPPDAVTLTDYDSPEAMALPGESPDPARFTAACAVQRAFIDWLRARGIAVRVRAFRTADYTAWLDGRPDTRSQRATYAATLTDGPAPSTDTLSGDVPWAPPLSSN